MKRGVLRPVGQPVDVHSGRCPLNEFDGYTTFFTATGTAALAQAIAWAVQDARTRQAPSVLLPAYGCPDLVAAALHAGATPVLIDTHPADPGYDVAALSARLDSTVAAVVAVDFLGIRERLGELRSLARSSNAWLIEDRAQSFPDIDSTLVGDAVVLSFGRGKPVNLLGGGAVLLRRPLVGVIDRANVADLDASSIEQFAHRIGSHWKFRMRAALFNWLSRPVPYSWISKLPGLNLGATRYRPLETVAALDAVRLRYLGSNAASWLRRDRWRERAWHEELQSLPGIDILASRLGDRAGRLLRFPVLLPSRRLRDAALDALRRNGLGASSFYGSPLPQVADVPRVVAAQGAFPKARSFADRLLVLPLHDDVALTHIRKAAELINRALAGTPV